MTCHLVACKTDHDTHIITYLSGFMHLVHDDLSNIGLVRDVQIQFHGTSSVTGTGGTARGVPVTQFQHSHLVPGTGEFPVPAAWELVGTGGTGN